MEEEALKLQCAVEKKKTGVADQSHKLCEKFVGEYSNIAQRVPSPHSRTDQVHDRQMIPGWSIASDRKNSETEDDMVRKLDASSQDDAKRKASTFKAAEEATAPAEGSNSLDQVAGAPKKRKMQSEQESSEEVVPYFEWSDLFDTVCKEAIAAEGSIETSPASWNTGQKADEKAEEIAVNTVSDLAHGSVQAKEMRHKCNMCDKAFTRSSHLKTHMSVHTGEKPYLCKLCGKAFSDSGTLGRHMRTHTGEKLYKCPTCDNAFGRSDILHQHMRVHTGEKPHQCPTCDKAFSHSSTLVCHIRVHTG